MIDDVQSFQNSQEDALTQINKIAKDLSKQYGLEALNGTNWNAETRRTYAAAFRQAQESMTMSMNASYADKFSFGGADGAEAPFELVPVEKKDAGGNTILDANGDPVMTKELRYRGVPVDVDNGSAEYAKLKSMAGETVYVDLGFGLTTGTDNNGRTTIANSSAFNTSLPGINAIGYGKNEDGSSQNLITLAGQLADILEQPEFDVDAYKKALNAFDESRNRVLDNLTTLGTKTNFLETTKTRLEDEELALTKQMHNVVDVDMAEAITEFSWAQYAYNAALKMGTSILSPSFIDFMS